MDFARAATGRGRGAFFGWDDCEGNVDVSADSPGGPCTLTNDVQPVLQYGHDAQHVSITGGVVVRDPGLQGLSGRYLFGDFGAPTMRSAVLGASSASGDRIESALPVSQLVSVGQDACERVYAVQYGGTVSRVQDSTPSGCSVRTPGEVGGGRLALRLGGPRRQRLRRAT